MQTLWGTHTWIHPHTAVRIPGQLTSYKKVRIEDLSPRRWEKTVDCPRTVNMSSEKGSSIGRDQSVPEQSKSF